MEPENNVDMIVDGYAKSGAALPLAVVGSAPHAAEYGDYVRKLAQGSDVRFLGSVWDQALLDDLYLHARQYFHGHSVGGTNPSLLRAMGAGAPVAALDVVFNREVLADTGRFFGDANAVGDLVVSAERDLEPLSALGKAGQARAATKYTWEAVTDSYERLCLELNARDPRLVAGRPRMTVR
jgi:glycosyltransferase involved in cell wall biosynthesis